MKLIVEEAPDLVGGYIEESLGQKKFFIEGIFLQSNIKNKNGRRYPREMMEAEVANYHRDFVQQHRAYGELGHPQGPQINLDRVSHIIQELNQDDNNWIGKALLTDTPYGNTAKGIISSGGKLGVSSRGLGSLKDNKTLGLQEVANYKIATAGDIVHDPSAPDAFVRGIMENVEWFYDESSGNYRHAELSEQVKKTVHKLSIKQIEERKLSLFETYLTDLAKK